MADGGSPLLQRRRLRAELKRARQARGLTQEQVANEMDWSLGRPENARGGARTVTWLPRRFSN